MSRRTPIFWTTEESKKLAQAAWTLRPAHERMATDGWARYVTRAQDALEPSRRKFIAGMHMIKPVMEQIQKLQANYPHGHVSEAEPVLQPIHFVDEPPRPSATETRIREQARPNYGRPGLAPLNPDEIRVIVNAVLDVIEERVRGYFIRHPPIASAAEPQATTTPASEAPNVAPSSEPARQNIDWNKQLQSVQEVARQHLRIGVVGFDAREQEQIARGLNQKVKLTFAYPHHHSKSAKLIDKVAGCNAIFVRVKWTSHAHIAALKKQLSTKCHFLENQPNAIKCADVINEWLKYTQAR